MSATVLSFFSVWKIIGAGGGCDLFVVVRHHGGDPPFFFSSLFLFSLSNFLVACCCKYPPLDRGALQFDLHFACSIFGCRHGHITKINSDTRMRPEITTHPGPSPLSSTEIQGESNPLIPDDA